MFADVKNGLQIAQRFFGQQLLKFSRNLIQILLQSINLFIQFLFFSFGRHNTPMHFVQGQSDDNAVEEDFIDSLDTFFKGDFFLEFFHFLFFGRFDDFPVDPVLDTRVSTTERHEETVEEGELFLLVFFLRKGEHRLGHCTDDKRDNLLERKPI
jgi:hypothetical protein